MNHTLDDLRGALDDAARDSYAPSDRLVGVRRAVARRRAVRAAVAGGTSLALVLGGVALGTVVLQRDAPSTAPVAGGVALLDEYYQGGRLAVTAEAPSTVGSSTTVSFTPQTLALQVRVVCDQPDGTSVAYRVSVDGRRAAVEGLTCGSSLRAGYGQDQQYWSDLGLAVGRPADLTLEILPAGGFGPSPGQVALPPDLDRADVPVALGVYADVPPAEYPFGPPPAEVARPQADQLGMEARDVVNPGDLGQAEVDVQVVFDPGAPEATLAVVATSPGEVKVLVEGRVLTGATFWDHDGSTVGLSLTEDDFTRAGLPVPAPKDMVAVTVVGERFAEGSWIVGVR